MTERCICKVCGKEHWINPEGKYAAQLREMCSECREASKKETFGLKYAAMDGSEKQIAWAEKIRRERVEYCQTVIDNNNRKFDALPEERKQQMADRMAQSTEAWANTAARIAGIKSARMLIDTRTIKHDVFCAMVLRHHDSSDTELGKLMGDESEIKKLYKR